MLTQHVARQIDDLARIGRTGPQLFDHRRIVPVRNEADILTVRLVRHRQPVFRSQGPRLGFRGEMAEREAQVGQLLGCSREQEIALVAVGIGRAMKLWPCRADLALNVVAGRHAVGLKIPGGLQQVLELHPLVAANAGHRRRARKIGVGEFVNHRLAEGVFVVEDVVGKAHFLGHAACVVDIAARTAGPLFRQRGAVVVKLQRDADHIIAGAGQQGGGDGGVHAPGHGRDHARAGRQPHGGASGLDGGVGEERVHGRLCSGSGPVLRVRARRPPPGTWRTRFFQIITENSAQACRRIAHAQSNFRM
ncbi:hypothetical protein GALL_535590 [mine drainage metagenome]|uniref:Uncharacterized protein n=1 Tax=mine drainage metagenome TaxID=410659 RepID=A0A1J5P019_9ZZZZ